ncbi:helix-turn-helix domain-containing protein [Heyndrickxia acidicola]|uniref:Helix-turn-helix domain-containing protein n=1 Tax=Heyndrickxia acidicola TaxID=209389 RepID=A0ABU6MH11_9BACI|nr:helix-turn-helix domain-containing protein [Heyndrickxia acidicola]MED1202562.1 helix-turn-helix domain-containing protein [Heyndrickxia acidicola]
MEGRKVYDKTNPGVGGKYWVPLPSDVRHYIHHDKMNADKIFLYALIIDYYNTAEGYAFPSVETLSVKYGKVPDTTSRHLKDLKEVGLIDFPEMGYYVPLIPLDETTFFNKFPDAHANYKQAIKRSDSRREGAADRMRDWRRKHGYTE